MGGTGLKLAGITEQLQALVPVIAWAILKEFYIDLDLSRYSLDDKAPPISRQTETNKSRHKLVSDLVAEGSHSASST